VFDRSVKQTESKDSKAPTLENMDNEERTIAPRRPAGAQEQGQPQEWYRREASDQSADGDDEADGDPLIDSTGAKAVSALNSTRFHMKNVLKFGRSLRSRDGSK
jgi:hypothetical protein